MVASKLFGGTLMLAGMSILIYYTLWVFAKVLTE